VFPAVIKDESIDDLQGLDKSQKHAKSSKGKRRTTQKDWDGRTLQITGHKAKTTGDAIVLLLESKLSDDEELIQSVQLHPDKEIFYVTFATDEG